MPLHIVTSKCFLACDRITFIKLDEFLDLVPTLPLSKNKKVGRPKKVVKPLSKSKINYRITIGYYPVVTLNNNYSGRLEPNECLLELDMSDKQKVHALYAEIVREVQEQHPSELYLDQLVNRMLEHDEFKLSAPQDDAT
jgi:hypothetical protein